MFLFKKAAIAAASACALTAAGAVHAAELLTFDIGGAGGVNGYGTQFLPANDDGSIGPLALPFGINFFGNNYSQFFLNNNGNITFDHSLSAYTPQAFPVAGQRMLAPFWGDVDTRGTGITNKVWYASPNANTLMVTWDQVGYYNRGTDKTNSFQLILSKRDDHGSFDAEYRYSNLTWTTGSASGGVGGLGGIPAQAGWDAGDMINYQTLPGSRTAGVLNLVNTSNVSDATPGVWRFSFVNGVLPGQSADNPIMPTYSGPSSEPGWHFNFIVPATTTMIYIDPAIAVGYEYTLNTPGASFTSVLLPNIGDGLYSIDIWNGSAWESAGSATAGAAFSFTSAINRFRVGDIELSANLDPSNPAAFVTGLTFSQTGAMDVTQTPISTAVPEPETLALMFAGLFVTGTLARRRQA